VRAPTLR